jgi:predicted phage terminase large subunit-like protein
MATMPKRDDRAVREFEVFLRLGALEIYGLEISIDAYLLLLCLAASRIVRRKLRRLICNLPPRHLKTLTLSIALAAWELAHSPTTLILVICHTEDLANDIASKVRMILQAAWFRKRYPTTEIEHGMNRADNFRTTAGGGVRALSFSGKITGYGGQLIIIDDPSDIDDAGAIAKLDFVNDRYENTISNRLNNAKDDRIVVVQHRLHQDDLSGHLLASDGGWTHLVLPFIAEADQTIEFEGAIWPRRAGELLRPDAYTDEIVEEYRRRPNFQAVYQQSPGVSAWGLTDDDFPRFAGEPFGSSVVLSIDTASSRNNRASWSVIAAFRSRGDTYYLLDLFRKRVDYSGLLEATKRMAGEHRASVILIEETCEGRSLCRDLLRAGFPVIPIPPPRTSKIDRFEAIVPVLREKRLWLPEDAHWLTAFFEEVLPFPASSFDDQIDTVTLALTWLGSNTPPPLKQERCMGVVASARDPRIRSMIRGDHCYVWAPKRR